MLNVVGRTQVRKDRGTRRVPSMVHEIIGLVHEPGTHVARLASSLAAAQSSSTLTGSTAGFSPHDPASKTYNIGLATILLGFNVLKEIVKRVAVSAALRRLRNTLARCEAFWNHSIAVAVTARRIAERHPACNPYDAFIAGLFHGIGAIVLGEDAEKGPHYGEETSWSTSDIESASVIAARWRLPLDIVEAIRYCRTPWLAQVNETLTAVTHVADVLCHRLNIGIAQHHYLDEFDHQALKLLQIRRDDLNTGSQAKLGELVRNSLSDAPRFEALASEIHDGLVYALEGLPDRQKLILALCYLEDLSSTDIARVVGVTEHEVEEIHGEAVQGLRTIILQTH